MGWGLSQVSKGRLFVTLLRWSNPISFFFGWAGVTTAYLRAFQMIQGCSHDAAPEKQSKVSDQYWKRWWSSKRDLQSSTIPKGQIDGRLLVNWLYTEGLPLPWAKAISYHWEIKWQQSKPRKKDTIFFSRTTWFPAFEMVMKTKPDFRRFSKARASILAMSSGDKYALAVTMDWAFR